MKKIYVADDDPNIINVVKFSLARVEGLQASLFDNGLDLYREIQLSPPDAIITDIILPRLDGLALSRLVKFDEKYRHIPLMIMSSVIDPDIEEQVKKVRADDFLRKPFRPQDIRERAAALCGLS
ncbi:MAG: PleD family two-component system response regulator [Candidatus Xenobiia bacterium LiM19]